MNSIWHNTSCSSSNNNQLLSSHLFLWATSHGNFYWKIKINNIFFFYRFVRTNFIHLYSEVPSYGCSIMPVREISYELKCVLWVQGYFTWYKVSQFLRSRPDFPGRHALEPFEYRGILSVIPLVMTRDVVFAISLEETQWTYWSTFGFRWYSKVQFIHIVHFCRIL